MRVQGQQYSDKCVQILLFPEEPALSGFDQKEKTNYFPLNIV